MYSITIKKGHPVKSFNHLFSWFAVFFFVFVFFAPKVWCGVVCMGGLPEDVYVTRAAPGVKQMGRRRSHRAGVAWGNGKVGVLQNGWFIMENLIKIFWWWQLQYFSCLSRTLGFHDPIWLISTNLVFDWISKKKSWIKWWWPSPGRVGCTCRSHQYFFYRDDSTGASWSDRLIFTSLEVTLGAGRCKYSQRR